MPSVVPTVSPEVSAARVHQVLHLVMHPERQHAKETEATKLLAVARAFERLRVLARV